MYWHRLRLVLAAQLTALLHLVAAAGQCGVPSTMTKIVGGQSVSSTRYPWFVALVSPLGGDSLSVSCGGSLVTSKHVLTAAHCFPDTPGQRREQMYRAVFQLVDRCDQTNIPSLAISRVNIFPAFDDSTLRGDVAIATLERTVTYMPVCLPTQDAVLTGEAVIVGFGSMLPKVQSSYPCQQQEARVTIFSRRQCARTSLPAVYSRIPGTLCAGVPRGGVDSCDGDSGGPLMTVGSDGAYTIRGITSFGEGCARKDLPGVYTQVSSYRNFIDRITGSGGSSESDVYPDLGAGDGGDDGTVDDTRDTPETSPTPSLVQAILDWLHPWFDSWRPLSSSGAGGASHSAAAGSHRGTIHQRPPRPWQLFWHGIFNRHRRPNSV